MVSNHASNLLFFFTERLRHQALRIISPSFQDKILKPAGLNLKDATLQLQHFAFSKHINGPLLACTIQTQLLNYIDPEITNNYKVVNPS